ncbi:MAG: hypothetical protein K2Q25_09235 [Mycobacteriaceae bacterium]|nr:hypothetical protein [Mycobacteriaceae bacterium]
MNLPGIDVKPAATAPDMSGIAATMAVLVAGLGYAVFAADPTILASAEPSSLVVMTAWSAIGAAFALPIGLSLAIVSDVFSFERRKRAIALLLTASFAITAALPAVNFRLAPQISWRTCILDVPVVRASDLMAAVVAVFAIMATPALMSRKSATR